MCGIAGVINLSGQPVPDLLARLEHMGDLQAHRGPDGRGTWMHPQGHVGFAHQRLSIIGLSDGAQPMTDGRGNWVTFNGEIYNYLELRRELGPERFRTTTDTEVILAAYETWGEACLDHLRGMFAFALWDESRQTLFCARDRFGIKPFYHTTVGPLLLFASEVKTLLPFLHAIETDLHAFREYLAFQLCLDGKTLFQGVKELLPAHQLIARGGQASVSRYWQVFYNLDLHHTEKFFEEELTRLLLESVDLHKRSDVPIGAYVSGGLDSSIVASLATRGGDAAFEGFTGKFSLSRRYDESQYAQAVGRHGSFPVHEIDITAADFIANFSDVIYHLDYPTAGPGSFAQYMVSRLAATRRKVVLGGQGADEVFGGYARYLIAYFEQCITAAIDGTMRNGQFVVTYESIIPNLHTLREYKPLLQEFFRDGMFGEIDRRYFRLVNRAPSLANEVNWDLLGNGDVFETFRRIFRANNVGKTSLFDLMTHFDFKTLLPALLQVEDRVSMAHGLESRVPFLDHPLVEFAATIPANVKFQNGTLKHLLRKSMTPFLPTEIVERKDKMGFPVPLSEWIQGEARDFVRDTLSTTKALQRDLIDNRVVLEKLDSEPHFGRKIWGLLCLEVWQQVFHDRAHVLQRWQQQVPAPRRAAA